MSTPAIRNITLVVRGAIVSGLVVEIGESISWGFTCQSPIDFSAFDLTGATIKMSLCARDLSDNPAEPPIATWDGVITGSPALGVVTVTWAPTATARTPPLKPDVYVVDLMITDGAGNRLAIMPASLIELRGSATLPV